MNKIVVKHLKYRYPLTTELALKDISFEIKKGEFIGLVGKNQSGKSTLCQAFVGLVPHFYKGAYGGEVFIDGIEVAKQDVDDMAMKVGLVFQNPFTQVTGAKMTVYEEIAFGLENMGIPRDEMMFRIDEALKLLDIYAYKDRNPFDLSGGQMQRMAIAGIVAMKPEIIVLDEPTSQLDPQGSEDVFKAIQSLSKQGMTVIMAEHKMEKIAKYSDRVLLLHEGELIDFDTPDKIFSRADLQDYGVVAPVYTRISKGLGYMNRETGLYPTTLAAVLGVASKSVEMDTENSETRMNKTIDIDSVHTEIKHTETTHPSTIQIEDLHFHYNENEKILKGLNIGFDSRSTAIIGQNGAGKTTFVKLMKGLLKPISGKLTINGIDTHTVSVAQLAKHIGLVFQNPNDQIFKNKVMDEVLFGPLSIGQSKEIAQQNAKEALEMVGLLEKSQDNPYDLCLSERKLVSIASIVAMDTPILIFDEPTIAQDFEGKERIKKLVKTLSAQGKLVLTIIHDMDFVAETFERVVVMADGQVLLDDTTQAVFGQKDILAKSYLETPHVTQVGDALGSHETFLTVEAFVTKHK